MGHFPQVGYGPYGFTGVQVAPGQETKRINRSTYGIVLGVFWVAMFAFVGIGAALVRVPNVPVLMADGTTKKLTSSLIKQGDGCELSLNDSACVAFWNERDVTPQQIKAINSAESKRTLFVLPALPFIIPLFIAQVRRLHDCGRSGAMLLFNLIPCVGFILMIVNASQGGEPYVNKYGPPPRSGINWRALYGKQSVS
jgi:uncharacterized membrane protein YhaH (DUF805 family)